MLGSVIDDPSGIESSVKTIDGIGIFDMKTVIAKEKLTTQVAGEIISRCRNIARTERKKN